jgi:hypothetical protein
MMFKGSARYGPGEVDRRTQALGGSNNAFTSHDVTVYWFAFAADRWHEALAIEADRSAACAGPGESGLERHVIAEEIALYDDPSFDGCGRSARSALAPTGARRRDARGAATPRRRRAGGVPPPPLPAGQRAVLVVAGAPRSARWRRSPRRSAASPRSRRADAKPPRDWSARSFREREGSARCTDSFLALPAPAPTRATDAELRLIATVLADGQSQPIVACAGVERREGSSLPGATGPLRGALAVAWSPPDLLPGTQPKERETRSPTNRAAARGASSATRSSSARRAFRGCSAASSGSTGKAERIPPRDDVGEPIIAGGGQRYDPGHPRAAGASLARPAAGSVVAVHLPEALAASAAPRRTPRERRAGSGHRERGAPCACVPHRRRAGRLGARCSGRRVVQEWRGDPVTGFAFRRGHRRPRPASARRGAGEAPRHHLRRLRWRAGPRRRVDVRERPR